MTTTTTANAARMVWDWRTVAGFEEEFGSVMVAEVWRGEGWRYIPLLAEGEGTARFFRAATARAARAYGGKWGDAAAALYDLAPYHSYSTPGAARRAARAFFAAGGHSVDRGGW